ncbi:DinB family protein [uncultured Tenacibaculum sp.]|uniref:DinB family protein n=1 Tax=uncultured Tenacibaculum sp. TaxID=174713 RepID=UPI002629E5CE|nr:DinB family protein [uncultured Tenacibaculum sp.]
MVFNTNELLQDLKELVESHINYVEQLQQLAEADLQKKQASTSWSAIECLEHLNLYAKFYNKEIRKRINESRYPKSAIFKSGFLGNKFALDMLPKEGMKTMKTFKSKNPIYSNLVSKEVLAQFLILQKELKELLEMAREVDLTKTKTAITLPLLKFRLGDTFRFVIYHNERHIEQAKRALK